MLDVSPISGPWRDCQHVLDSGENASAIYLLRPRGTNRLLQAWCEQSQAQGGWTVIQKRQDGSVNFFRTWEQYKVTPHTPEKKHASHITNLKRHHHGDIFKINHFWRPMHF